MSTDPRGTVKKRCAPLRHSPGRLRATGGKTRKWVGAACCQSIPVGRWRKPRGCSDSGAPARRARHPRPRRKRPGRRADRAPPDSASRRTSCSACGRGPRRAGAPTFDACARLLRRPLAVPTPPAPAPRPPPRLSSDRPPTGGYPRPAPPRPRPLSASARPVAELPPSSQIRTRQPNTAARIRESQTDASYAAPVGAPGYQPENAQFSDVETRQLKTLVE